MVVATAYRPFDTLDSYVNLHTPDLDGDLILEGGRRQAVSSGASQTTQAVVMLGDGRGGFTFNRYLPKRSNVHIVSDMAHYDQDSYLEYLQYSLC